jgi:hypothetical protein
MPAYADAAIVTLLDALVSGSTTLASGTDLFTGPARSHGQGIPIGPVVFALSTGGPPPQPYLGVGKDFRVETVQVTVRAKPEKFADGQTLARAVFDAVHKTLPTDFVDCRVRESQPTYLGADGNGCHLWTLNCELSVVRAT